MTRWLILDAPNIAWRCYHSLGFLKHESVETGVTFGFLRELVNLQKIHGTRNVAICFDSVKSLRREIYPKYKSYRKSYYQKVMTDGERETHDAVRRQIKQLRKEHLPALGFRNVFLAPGLEADDLIASLCKHALKDRDTAVIVSTDRDLYQLLCPSVVIWAPSKRDAVTDKSFTRTHGVVPSQWPMVKAMAGCGSDDVDGIHGVGELSACRFLSERLKEGSVMHRKVLAGEKVWKRNLKLVRLPFKGCPRFEFVRDEATEGKWDQLCRNLGMKSLVGALRN